MKVNWFVAIFVALTDSSTRLRQILWRWVYNKIAIRDPSGNFLFMNYGFHDDHIDTLSLKSNDEPYRYFIQLYNHVVKDIDMQNKDIIEVGCGRGGGGAFFLNYKNVRSYIGIDLSEKAIEWCKRQFQFSNAQWMEGDADKLPIPDKSMDVLVNVESSHCYPSMQKFLNEAYRILRSNGYMAFCDLRRISGIELLDANIAASGFQVIDRHEISPHVLKALDNVSQTRDKQIISVFPAIFHRAIRDFAAVKDTTVYNMLKNGEMKYLCYLLQKKNQNNTCN